jgi:hypothetical protein
MKNKRMNQIHTKGQLISNGRFGVIVSTKKPTKLSLWISALASKKNTNQENYYIIMFF